MYTIVAPQRHIERKRRLLILSIKRQIYTHISNSIEL